MKITIIGTGYVGLVTGACLADLGNDVVCLDVDRGKIALLASGAIPIHEPGLAELVQHNARAGRLQFTTDPCIAAQHGQVQFIAVGTPPGEDGSADLQHVLAAARGIGKHVEAPCVVVNKSTVPVGTAASVRMAIGAELEARGLGKLKISVVSNPEFLKEGAAIEDFMRPDRIVIGSDDPEATETMRRLYAPLERNRDKLMVMDIASAELTKYAANAMLATRISFMNEMALLAERLGADIDAIRRGIGSDPRIGNGFLYAGCGYGGSCFPKDVKALLHTAQDAESPMRLLHAVETVNARQKLVLIDKVAASLGADLTGRTIAIWGLSFKPETDDMREAPSLVVIGELQRRGARIQAYDPVAMAEARRLLGASPDIEFCASAMGALTGADALIVVTEWKEFRSPDFERMRDAMRGTAIFDGRNILDRAAATAAGFAYTGIGRS
jgi:UDPglucose 6-dehydrogenase